MTTGESVMAKIKLASEDKINDVIDWFGSDISVQTLMGETYVHLRVNEEALVYWSLQYGESVEIVSPASTRAKIKDVLNKILSKYE